MSVEARGSNLRIERGAIEDRRTEHQSKLEKRNQKG